MMENKLLKKTLEVSRKTKSFNKLLLLYYIDTVLTILSWWIFSLVTNNENENENDTTCPCCRETIQLDKCKTNNYLNLKDFKESNLQNLYTKNTVKYITPIIITYIACEIISSQLWRHKISPCINTINIETKNQKTLGKSKLDFQGSSIRVVDNIDKKKFWKEFTGYFF